MANEMSAEKTGFVFDIQRGSLHDGPGIRTTVFLKGCPLKCAWCHNPESQSMAAELAWDASRCIGCGACASACPNGCHVFGENGRVIRRADCTVCGKCAEDCSPNALSVIGKTMTVAQVIDEVMVDRLFYSVSGGGMTVSGGEPMVQHGFTLELLKAAKCQGIHTCLETCGYCAPDHLVRCVPYTDLFLFDLKTTADNHAQWTGVPLAPIQSSLQALDAAGGRIVLRCPLIPGVNMNDRHMQGIAQTAAGLRNILEINLEPYHPVGISKCEAIGRISAYAETKMPTAGEAELWAAKLRGMTGVPVVII